jgi:hypothetical protein
MSILEQTVAVETQLKNIQGKTGRTVDELAAIIQKIGLNRHGEIRDLFHREFGLGYGDANALTHAILAKLTETYEVDRALLGWIEQVYEGAAG